MADLRCLGRALGRFTHGSTEHHALPKTSAVQLEAFYTVAAAPRAHLTVCASVSSGLRDWSLITTMVDAVSVATSLRSPGIKGLPSRNTKRVPRRSSSGHSRGAGVTSICAFSATLGRNRGGWGAWSQGSCRHRPRSAQHSIID